MSEIIYHSEIDTNFFQTGVKNSEFSNMSTTQVQEAHSDMDAQNIKSAYWIKAPFSFAVIKDLEGGLQYEYSEVSITDEERVQKIRTRIEDTVEHQSIDYHRIHSRCNDILEQRSFETFCDIYHAVKRDRGYGDLYSYIVDISVEDLSHMDDGDFIYHTRYGDMQTHTSIDGAEEFTEQIVDNFDVNLSGEGLFGEIEDKVYVRCSSKGNGFNIEMHNSPPVTPVHLYNSGTFTSESLSYLWLAVENDNNLVVAGQGNSGKTTVLESILHFVPNPEELTLIQDTNEISVPYETDYSLYNGLYESSKRDLLESTLRRRPSLIAVDEMRVTEAREIFDAMSTGHTIYSTINAEYSSHSTFARLQNKPIDIPNNQLESIDVICYQGQTEDGYRCIEILEFYSRNYRQPISTYHHNKGLRHNIEGSSIEDKFGMDEIERRARIIESLSYEQITSAEDVRQIIEKYYELPQSVAEHAEKNELKQLL